MKKIIHPVAGIIAMLTIATFWFTTALSEMFGSAATVTAVKSAIPWGFLILIPALAVAGGSGIALARGRRAGLIGTKLKRMPFIAANGLLVLIPAALFLASKAKAGEFDTAFYIVQAIELLAGPVNFALLGFNMRDGLRMTDRLNRKTTVAVDVPLLSSETVAEGTMSFRFAKPAGFTHIAGQSAVFTLINPPEMDDEGASRTFTIASAPHQPELMITTRMRDTAFKRALKALPTNSAIRLSGLGGAMTLHDDPGRPAVFLAGGIGITPFLAMARHAAYVKLPVKVILFYSNRRPEDAAFLDELQQLAQTNIDFRLIATMTAIKISTNSWQGEIGNIDEAMLRRHIPDVRLPVYYLAGPAAMVAAMRAVLEKMGIDNKDIRYEEFYGY